MAITEGAIIGGKFRLERQLAQGGMGSVWVARHQLLDTDVAVKFMDPSIAENESARQRFEREAKAAVAIKSPHVVQVFDYGIDDGAPYIAMELLDGEDLDHRLERLGPMDPEKAFRVLEQLGKALRRAHELGIVHRDLKPGNIFLQRHGDEEIVKVLDFGIAKDVTITGSASATSTGALLGSPSYMSPEQIRATKLVDHRSDLWAIGVILYEVITGRLPFDESENIGKLLVSICTDPFLPPSVLVPALSIELDRFFEKALSRDMNGRFQSVTELVEAFGVAVGVVPTRAGLLLAPEAKGSRASSPDRSIAMEKTLLEDPVAAKSADRGASTRVEPVESRSSLSPSESGERGGSSRKRFVPVLLAAVGLAGMLGVIFTLRTPEAPKTSVVDEAVAKPAPQLANAPAVSNAGALREVRVTIEPADASVEVNGRIVTVNAGGYITISGDLGSKHAVKVFKDKLEQRGDVAITADGAFPDKLSLAKDVKVDAPTVPAGTTAAGVKTKDPATPVTTPAPLPTALPTTAKTATKPPNGDPGPDREFN